MPSAAKTRKRPVRKKFSRAGDPRPKHNRAKPEGREDEQWKPRSSTYVHARESFVPIFLEF
jgi:hypothetical protein